MITELSRYNEVSGVEAPLNYIAPDCDGAIMYEFERTESTLRHVPHVMPIANARLSATSLDREGYQLVSIAGDVDFTDAATVEREYFPRIEALMKRLLGASEVIVFGPALRSDDGEQVQAPARGVHVDFDEKTTRNFVRQFRPETADRLLAKRFVLANVWLAVKPVERTPLALCDARSIAPEDLRVGLVGTMSDDPDFEPWSGYNFIHNPAHRWSYFPHMQPGEAIVFKLCDSRRDVPQLTAHTAFDDPTSPPDAPFRYSFEVRTISFID